MATKVPPPAANRTLSPPLSPAKIKPPNKGATMLINLPQKAAMPVALPLTELSKTSGVQAYKTALKIVWQKNSTMLNARFPVEEVTVAKRKRLVAIIAELTAITKRLLILVQTKYMEIKDPGIPARAISMYVK